MIKISDGIYLIKGRFATKNLNPGKKVYGERLLYHRGTEYREWVPFRSKFAAALKKKLKTMPIKYNSAILYLGIAEGTTASHFSDIIGNKGLILGIDISEQTMRRLLRLCEDRKNIIPVLADASNPESYARCLKDLRFDIVYQDISQRNQIDILNKNAELLLKPDGFALLALKAKSISSTTNVSDIFRQQERMINKKFRIVEKVSLEPFEKDHMFYVLKVR